MARKQAFIDVGMPFEEPDDAEEIRDEHIALMPRTLVTLWQLAQMRDEDRAALQTRWTQKIGRNEPCPSGSVKKFKRCCAH